MQKRDDKKREAIIAAAVKQFSSRPFHEVLLDEIAAAAKVGKGTVYIYFSSKEDLYDTIVLETFDKLIAELRRLADSNTDTWSVLSEMVRHLMQWAYGNPHFYRMIMQSVSDRVKPSLVRKRKDLGDIFGIVLRRGIEEGDFEDSQPLLTAQYIPACVRASVLYGPVKLEVDKAVEHLLSFLESRLRKGQQS